VCVSISTCVCLHVVPVCVMYVGICMCKCVLVSLPLCIGVCVCVLVYGCICVCVSVFPSPFLLHSLSIFPCVVCPSPRVWCVHHSVSHPLCISLCMWVCMCLCARVRVHVCMCVNVYVCVYVCVVCAISSLSVYVCASLCFPHSFPLHIYFSIPYPNLITEARVQIRARRRPDARGNLEIRNSSYSVDPMVIQTLIHVISSECFLFTLLCILVLFHVSVYFRCDIIVFIY